ncbi:MAG: galactose-1-epimerase [Plesiomonas sp.]|uniref:galactose-1-epimerase n=1 Tax=Plesiomonas sp. TaxID=2486279 RepID=UPI003F2F14B1
MHRSPDFTSTMTQPWLVDGLPAKLVTLTNRYGMQLTMMDIGATWLSCCLPLQTGELREVLLGVSTLDDFMRQSSYMGVTVGRYANRIANGCFTLEGHVHRVSMNQAGHCLHGGQQGFHHRRWAIELQTDNQVTFSLVSPGGDQGFPGNLTVSVTYRLTDVNQVEIHYRATTDQATPVNLTNHAYFNLHGAESDHDCRLHRLRIHAAYFLPTHQDGIPENSLKTVTGTGFDFLHGKQVVEHFLRDQAQIAVKGYDHSFWFDPARDLQLPVAELTSLDQEIQMQVFTDKPAMQLYTGNWLAGTPNRRGGAYSDFAGLALETQFLPDSPNHPDWPQPSCILYPENVYRSTTVYQFHYGCRSNSAFRCGEVNIKSN